MSFGAIAPDFRPLLCFGRADMRVREDLIGCRFGKLVVQSFSHTDVQGRSFWTVRCDCGVEKPERADNLKNGHHVSCGRKGCKFGDGRERRKLYPSKSIKNRDWQLRKLYGIGLDDYERMYAKQKGCCAICKTHRPKLYVDHNHETGEVRKLLCQHCNSLLGYCRENVNTLISAIRYLRG